MPTITIVAGARPNFMKIAPIIHQLHKVQKSGLDIGYRLVHTGQHYDANMSGSFFKELSIQEPNVNLECSGGTQAEQTAKIMMAFEKDLADYPSDLVLVVGDVTSTMACSIVAKKAHTKVAHIEAGIRSGDLKMPEEINRMVTDSITDYFFTTSELATQNLVQLGHPESQIFLVGNTMIDTLLTHKANFKKPGIWDELHLKPKAFIVLTMHRPSNVDESHKLKAMIEEIMLQTKDLPIVFPAHPRTKTVLNTLGIQHERLHTIAPLSYLEFNYLVQHAKAVITDSGGITEEASILNVPCLTIRDTTERPETISLGTNVLVGTDSKQLKKHLEHLFNDEWKQAKPIPFWDGKTAERIVDVLVKQLLKR